MNPWNRILLENLMQVPASSLPTDSSFPGFEVCVFLCLFMQMLGQYVKADHDIFCPI